MRDIYNPAFRLRGWFSPQLDMPGWYDSELVEESVVVLLNLDVTEAADAIQVLVTVPRSRPLASGNEAGFIRPETLKPPKQIIGLNLWAWEKPDRIAAVVTVLNPVVPEPPPRIDEVPPELMPIFRGVEPVPVIVWPVHLQMLATEGDDKIQATATVIDWVKYDNEALLLL